VTKVGRRWAWTCSRCAPPAAGSTYTLGDTLANAAEHMSRCKWHHRWVAAHLGATIGRTDTRHGQENTDPAAASSRGAPRPGRAAPGGRADHA
jgi:aldehyde:ferredoxin oxidoreductase